VKPPFQVLGALLALYIAYAIVTGRVFAKHRWWGKTILRDESPGEFWTVIALYAALTLALVFVF